MFRSLLSLILFTNVSAAPLETPAPPSFDPLNLLVTYNIPVKIEGALAPVIKAKAALVMDANSGIVLFEKNAHERLPMASLTKIMTAIIILENHDLNEVVTVTENYNDSLGVRIGLQKNERITVENLLTGLLVRSGGDAAMALATHHSGSEEAFVMEMNQKAALLKLSDSRFQNPVGLDADNHYASAYDLALLSRYAMRNPVFRSIVRLSSAEISSVDGTITHSLHNTNQLLGSYLNVLGVKTGTTDAAGQSIINLARSEEGHEIVAVLLNSPNRFQENKSLIDWSFRNFLW